MVAAHPATAATGVVAPVTVVTGAEEYLVAREVRAILRRVREQDPAAELRELDEVGEAELADLDSPTLLGGRSVVVIRDVAALAEAARAALLRYAGRPLPELVLVLTVSAPARSRKLVESLTGAGAALVACPAPSRPSERVAFVVDEAAARGATMTGAAARLLLDAVGNDLRELAAATAQLVADTAGRIDEAAVSAVWTGRAETRGFDVADAAVGGNREEAVALLAAALAAGVAPVLVTSALAGALRDLVRVRGAGPGPAAALAGRLGLPPWKVDKALRQGRGWADGALGAALTTAAAADAAVKGGAADPAWALYRAVLTIAGLHGTAG